ncbi:MAG: hypothetical protein WCK02_12900 [Bacteroidota bacterium]
MNQNIKLKPITICSIGLFVSFFLPWVSISIFEISGFNIPRNLDLVSSILKISDSNKSISNYSISYLLYIIPILCIYNIYNDIYEKKRRFVFSEFIVCFCLITSILFFFYFKNIKLILNFGFYLTMVFTILAAYMDNKAGKPVNNNQ